MTGSRSLFVVVLTVPLIAFVAAQGLRARMDGELRAAMRASMPEVDPARVAAVTLAELCTGTEPRLARPCGDYEALGYLRAVAGAAGLAGLGLLLAIRLAGSVAGRSRAVLLAVFRPGLYVTALGVIALIAVHGGLAVATLFYVESMLTGRLHTGIIAAVAAGVFVGVAAVTRGMFSVVRPAEVTVIGARIDRARGRQLYQRVEALAKRLGALRPQHVVVGLDPNFFVTEARVRCLNGVLAGRTLYCSLPLARLLTHAEFDAVIGHELGHFRGQDTRFSQRFYPIYRGTADSLRALRHTAVGGVSLLPLLPAMGVVSHFLNAFALAERQHGRARELAADLDGACVSDTEAMASALVKVHAFGGAWDGVCDAAIAAVRDGERYENVSTLFAEVVARDASREMVRSAGAVRTTHPTDSHPPLNVRLEALGTELKKVEARALQVAPSVSAISLIDDPAEVERELSEQFQAVLAKHIG